MTEFFASRWMQSPNYGRAIASRYARLSARYYRAIIALLVMALLVLELVRAPTLPKALTAGSIVLYTACVVGRLLLPAHWLPRYFRRI